jgi:hypothetical protein
MNHATKVMAIALLVWTASSAQDLQQASLEISVVDGFGDDLTSYEASLSALDGEVIRAASRAVKRMENVPYGEYRLTVTNSCCRAQRAITVNQPKMWVRIGVPLRFGDAESPGGFLVISGSVNGLGPRRSYRARVRGLFLDESREMPLEQDSSFAIGGLDPGIYTVEVLSGKSLVHWRLVTIDLKQHETEIQIKLPPDRKR